jgi:hypothetical protein
LQSSALAQWNEAAITVAFSAARLFHIAVNCH